jgi:hypothetical protein
VEVVWVTKEAEVEVWVMKEAGEAGDMAVVGEEWMDVVVEVEKTRHDSNGC